MNFIKSLLRGNDQPLSKFWEKDIFASEGLRKYFESKEAIYAYCTDVGITKKREIAPLIEEVLNQFLEHEFEDQ